MKKRSDENIKQDRVYYYLSDLLSQKKVKRRPSIIDLILKEREKHKEPQHLRWERLLKQVCWTIFCFALGFVVAVNVLKSRSLTGVFGSPCS